MKHDRLRLRRIATAAVMAALIAVGSFVKIPISAIPVTLQLAFTVLAGLLLGGRTATIAVIVYISIGLMGLPVFTSGGGLGSVLTPTFGYLIGMVFGSFAAGTIAHGLRGDKSYSFKRYLLGAMTAIAIVYVVGVPYMYLINTLYLGNQITAGYAVIFGALIFLPSDTVFGLLAVYLAKRLAPALSVAIVTAESEVKQTEI